MKSWRLGIIFFISTRVFGQGCSDAGLCSIGGLESLQNRISKTSIISFAHNIGMGEHFERGERKTIINSFIVGGKVFLRQGTMVDMKLPYTVVTGDLATTSGIGDISISVSQQLHSSQDQSLLLTLGTRLKTNNANRTKNGRPLPMPFQTSLGTNDLLLGLTANRRDWQFSIGYQHPFGRNKNAFLKSAWPDDQEAQEYFESSGLKRGDDLAIRVEKRFEKQRFDLFVGMLGLYRIEKDEIIKEDSEIKLSRSSAPTININGTYISFIS